MENKDLGEELDKIEGLKDKKFNILGISMTPTTLGMAFAGLSSVIGMLYAGFTMYQKIEEVASLDVGAFEQRMELINDKIDNQEKLLTSIEGNIRDTKQQVYDIEKRVNDKVVYFETKMDKFENKVEKTKEDFEDKLQEALNNPLSDG